MYESHPRADVFELANTTQSTNSGSRVEPVALDRIKDGGAQMRVEMRPETVNDYATDLLDGATFPPIIVFDDGTDLWLADGFHRVEAHRKIERAEIMAEIRAGTARDAILYAIGSNATHGLRRSQADKRRAVERLLRDPEWSKWSDRKIAKAARVDNKTVAAVRRALSEEILTPTPTRNRKPNGGGEEILTPTPTKANGGGTADGKPSDRGSVLADLLKSVSDEALIAECQHRGFVVEGGTNA